MIVKLALIRRISTWIHQDSVANFVFPSDVWVYRIMALPIRPLYGCTLWVLESINFYCKSKNITLTYDLRMKIVRVPTDGELCKQLIKLIKSTLVISNSKGLSEILRDIRTSTYQICRIEEKITRTTTFNKYMCNWALEVEIENIVEKGSYCSIGAISPLFHNIFTCC